VAVHCHLCGQPVPTPGIEEGSDSDHLHFCCLGCRQVFQLLCASTGALPEGFRETELFRACVEWGIIPGPEGGPSAGSPVDVPGLQPLDLTFRVVGMWCPSCAWLIREVLARSPGVTHADVSFATDTVRLKYLPHKISPETIVARAQRLGYAFVATERQEAVRQELGTLLLRLGVSSILTANIMMISFALYSGYFHDLPTAAIRYFSYPLLGMAAIVLIYGGLPILKRGWAALVCGLPSMDTLVSLGALSSFVYSAIQVAHNSLYVYFDTSSMLVTLVLIGRYVETRARERTSSSVADLYRVVGGKVRIAEAHHERWINADAVRQGERFAALLGDTVPMDSKILKGRALCDLSFLTGEPKPLARGPGDEVAGGSIMRGTEEVLLEALRTVGESTIGRIIETVEEALRKRGRYELMADGISRVFVPVVVAIAAATGLFSWLAGVRTDNAFLRSLTILLIACPCALGIAVPLVKVAIIGAARKKGILIREPGVLEKMKDVDTVVFDKTGTLTQGSYSLEAIVMENPMDRRELMGRLASVEAHSSHFLAHEIVREAKCGMDGIKQVEAFEAFPGLGVKGRTGGMDICIGSKDFMERSALKLGRTLAEKGESRQTGGRTVVFFGWVGSVQGFLVFNDALKPRARELIDAVRARAMDVWLVSGDSRETTLSVAGSLGISRFVGGVLPQAKVEMIRSLQAGGHRVAMIGDGINDAAALAIADAGCAIGAGADLAHEVCDIGLMASDPASLLDAFDLSALAAKAVRQNLVFAFFYNAVAIPLAAAGLLNPLLAVVAMFASSLLVTGNALRVSRKAEAMRSFVCSSGLHASPADRMLGKLE
jgi:heavy metal translocating P-type ATPase